MTTLMLVKKTSLTVATLATTILLSICTPVRAFMFGTSGIQTPVRAFMFGTSGIQFDQDTNIKFTFDQSHGAYQSSLWVAQGLPANAGYNNISRLFYETKPSDNGTANKSKGTFGNAVTSDKGSITQTFTFLKDQIYALLLWSDTGTGNPFEEYISSNTFMNSSLWFSAGSKFSQTDCPTTGCQQAVFGDFSLNYDAQDSSFSNANGGKGPEQFQSVTLAQLIQGTKIALDDGQKPTDVDFQEFSLSAELVPEPVTVFGSIMGIGALAAARTKKKREQQPKK